MPHRDWIGKVLDGKYLIEALLGEGGFGVVFKARQVSMGKVVAVKMIRPQILLHEDEEHRTLLVERFRRELKLVAMLDHPHVVALLDAGGSAAANASAPLYAVFQFIKGKTLTQAIAEQGCLSVYETRRVMFQALEALAHAHTHGVIHRDFKPDNVMLSGAIPEQRNAYVLDFGIAGVKALPPDVSRPMALTREEDRLGSPAYMAPEQVKGATLTTPATDLYAWGLVYLECLTGQRVAPGTSVWEALLFHGSDVPIPIPEKLRGLVDSTWVLWCLSKNPAERPAVGGVLLEHINDALQRETPERLKTFTETYVGKIQGMWRVFRRLLGVWALLAIFGRAMRAAWRAFTGTIARDFMALSILLLSFLGVGYYWLVSHPPEAVLIPTEQGATIALNDDVRDNAPTTRDEDVTGMGGGPDPLDAVNDPFPAHQTPSVTVSATRNPPMTIEPAYPYRCTVPQWETLSEHGVEGCMDPPAGPAAFELIYGCGVITDALCEVAATRALDIGAEDAARAMLARACASSPGPCLTLWFLWSQEFPNTTKRWFRACTACRWHP